MWSQGLFEWRNEAFCPIICDMDAQQGELRGVYCLGRQPEVPGG